MDAFSSRAFTSCRALRIATGMAKFQIIICPTDITKWSIRQDGCQADETIAARTGASLRPSNGLCYKHRTKKVTNAIAMTANWKKDVELGDDEICQGIRRKPYGLLRCRKIGRTKN